MNKSDLVLSIILGLGILAWYKSFLESKWFYDIDTFLGEHTIISLQFTLISSILLSIGIVGLCTRWDILSSIKGITLVRKWD